MQGQVAFRSASPSQPLPREIAFLERYGIAPEILHMAASSAAATGVAADIVLLNEGWLADETFYAALAAELNLPFLQDPHADASARFPHSVLNGLIPLSSDRHKERIAMAPRGDRVAALLSDGRQLGPGLALTTPSALTRAVLRTRWRKVSDEAAGSLANNQPHRSYRDGPSWLQIVWLGLGSAGLAAGGTVAPEAMLTLAALAMGALFLGMVVPRIEAIRHPIAIEAPPPSIPDAALPIYTIIVPLRRERAVLARLLCALDGLAYPKAKLDIKLVVDADDREMRDAFELLQLPACFEVIIAPPGEPRTKPRALNVALPLARGELAVVYDAEDVPEAQQLRLAAETLTYAAPDVACLQARLVIDNAADSWLTRLFAIEYAALFDVINPSLARLDLPVLLGGTSNHFRTAVLRELHGWDAWNVTEDADLGIRLALAGYRVMDLPSATFEEAPGRPGPWLRQRTRWMKGFMQVIVSHSRRPVETLRLLRPAGFLAALTMTVGTVATALCFPVLALLSIAALADGTLLSPKQPIEVALASLGLVLFVAGGVAMIAPAVVGIARRSLWRLLPCVALLPIYYGLISLAAWRALLELIAQPSQWHKTEHGLARTSRSGRLTTAATGPAPPRQEADRG